jgi:predicted O-methyltransferase YrrM
MSDTSQMPPGFGYEKLFAGQRAQHSFMLHHHISRILLDRPDVKAIVEIGTSLGALSIYLGLWGARRGIPVHTFDRDAFAFKAQHNVDELTAEPIFTKLGIKLHTHSVFSADGHELVAGLLDGGPVYLFCDGGDKPREFQTFAPMLHPGSAVSTHDWPGEIRAADVAATVRSCSLVPWQQKLWSSTSTATWLKD